MTGLVITIITIFLSALPASIGYLIKVRSDRQRAAKRVLYYLLEIRHAAFRQMLSPDDLLKAVASAMEASFRRYDPNVTLSLTDFPSEISGGIVQFFEKAILSRKGSLPDNEAYYASLDMLAQDYPVLAFRIRGNEYLNKMIEVLDEYKDWYSALLEKEGSLPEAVKQATVNMAGKGSKSVREDIFGDLNEDVSSLAEVCGIRCSRAVKKILQHKPSFEPDDNLKREMDRAIDEFILEINTAVANGTVAIGDLKKMGNPANA